MQIWVGAPGALGAMAELREDEDEAYFSSYGHYGILEDMFKVRCHNGLPARMHILMPSIKLLFLLNSVATAERGGTQV